MIPVVNERTTRSKDYHRLLYYANQHPHILEFETRFRINQYQLFKKVPLNDDIFIVSKAPKFAALKK